MQRTWLWVLALLLSASGCVSQGRMIRTAYFPMGEMRVMQGEPQEVLQAATRAGFQLGLRGVTPPDYRGFQLMETSVGYYSWGSFVGIHARSLSPGRTAMWVDERRSLSTTVMAPKATHALFALTAEQLGMQDMLVDYNWAPTTPEGAMLSSLLVTVSGAGLLMANVGLWLGTFPRQPVSLSLMALAGALLYLWGPNVGDAMNGDWKRFGFGGLIRLCLIHPMFGLLTGAGGLGLSTISVFGQAAAAFVDSIEAKNAPKRWAQRQTSERLRESATPEERELTRKPVPATLR